jgi:DNA-binding GntR family transcriptional regulator
MSSSPEVVARTPATAPMFKKNVLADDVYEHFKSLIMDHSLEPETSLKIDVLARELGVSPTPVREALLRLETDSLVTKRGNRYFTNPVINRAEFEDLWEFRLCIEPWAAALAARRATKADLDSLRTEVEHPAGMGKEMDFSKYRAMQEHDQRFHDLIFRIARNDSAHDAFTRAHVHLRTFRILYASQLGLAGVHEHGAIAEAISNGDPHASQTAMTEHLEHSLERLRPFVQG